MRTTIFALFLVTGSAQAAPSLRAGEHIDVKLPPTWDEDTHTMQTPDFITVQAANAVDTCSFAGGPVTMKKVDGEKIYFDPADVKKNDRCAHLMAPVENIRGWYPEAAAMRSGELKRKQEEFRAQLKEDVKGILDKSVDPCTPQDRELKTGMVYSLQGRLFTYGPGTTATTVEGKTCQVELGGLVEVLGYNRGHDQVVASYYHPHGSTGEVPVGSRRVMTKTCPNGGDVVFSLAKLKGHFQLAQASTRENLEVKGIAAVLSPRSKVCINETGEKAEADGARGHHKHGGGVGRNEEEPRVESGGEARDAR